MKYAYEDLGDEQFERLVVLLSQKLLGISVQGFATGPDGGRDGKFVGSRQSSIPARPLRGSGRRSSKQSTQTASTATSQSRISIPSMQKRPCWPSNCRASKSYRDAKQLDHYMLFANRRLTGNGETEIRAYISKGCGLPIESIYFVRHRTVGAMAETFSPSCGHSPARSC